MDPYKPYLNLSWYYRTTEDWIKIKSSVIVKYNPGDGANRITAAKTALVDGIGAIETLTVHQDGTADPNPVELNQEWNAIKVGTGASQEDVERFISNFKSVQILVTLPYLDKNHEVIGTTSQNSDLDYQ